MVEKAYADQGQDYQIEVTKVDTVSSRTSSSAPLKIEYHIIDQDVKVAAALYLTKDKKGIERATFTSPLDQPWQVLQKQARSPERQEIEQAVIAMIDKGGDKAKIEPGIKVSTTMDHKPNVRLHVNMEGDSEEKTAKRLPYSVRQLMDDNVEEGKTTFGGLAHVPLHVLLKEEVLGIVILVESSNGNEDDLTEEEFEAFVSKLDWSALPNGNYQIDCGIDYLYNFKVVDGRARLVEDFPFEELVSGQYGDSSFDVSDMTDWPD